MITTIKAFKESILVPRNLEDRHEKGKQKNYQMLQQEVIVGDLVIDEYWDFDPNTSIIKTKVIKGFVIIDVPYFPKWLKNVIIDGSLDCSYQNLTSLEGCPQKITYTFLANGNELRSLEGGPKEVGLNYYVQNNNLTSLKGAPERLEGEFQVQYNKLTSLEYGPKYVGSYYHLYRNKKQFSKEDVLKYTQVDTEDIINKW